MSGKAAVIQMFFFPDNYNRAAHDMQLFIILLQKSEKVKKTFQYKLSNEIESENVSLGYKHFLSLLHKSLYLIIKYDLLKKKD